MVATNPAGPPTMEGESVKPSPQPTEQAGDGEKNRRMITVNPAHMGKAFKVMNELRSKRLLCDVMIVAEDVEVEAHRVVLAACSPYFCAMFTGDMSESKAKKIEIKDVDGQTLSKLIDYIYTAEIEVTEENVQAALLSQGVRDPSCCLPDSIGHACKAPSTWRASTRTQSHQSVWR